MDRFSHIATGRFVDRRSSLYHSSASASYRKSGANVHTLTFAKINDHAVTCIRASRLDAFAAVVDGTFKRMQNPEAGRQNGTTGVIVPMAVLDSGGVFNMRTIQGLQRRL